MMTNDRAKKILASYGADCRNWPVNERALLQQYLSSNVDLQKIQQQELQLDEQLIKMYTEVNISDTQLLQKRILASLPKRKSTSNSSINHFSPRINKLLLNRINLFLNPTGATATMMVVIFLAIGIFGFNYESPAFIENNIEDEWLLMAEALDSSNELELLAVLEPELYEELI